MDPVFGAPNAHGGLEVLVAIYAYAIVIYADFSAYSDIAIGVALLLGFEFPENFDRPYTAMSLRDFWRRWHMTLSRWLRDYLYIPLGGSRHGELRTAVNIMITMLLGGLWHGAGWTFVAWGAFHGVGQVIGRWRRATARGVRDRRAVRPRWIVARKRLVTFNLVCLGWVFFRADSIASAFEILGRLGAAGAHGARHAARAARRSPAMLGVQYLPARSGGPAARGVRTARAGAAGRGARARACSSITTLGAPGRDPVHLLPVLR